MRGRSLVSSGVKTSVRALGVLAWLAATGCVTGDDEVDVLDAGPLWAVMFEIYDDLGSTSYLSLIDSLDVEAVDPSTSREFIGGRAYMQTYDGWLFVGLPAEPVVLRYRVAEDGSLEDEQRISFANYGLEAGTIDDWSNVFISPEKAYLFDYREATHIVWNPTTMEIVGEIPAPPSFRRDGWSTASSPPILRDGKLYRSIHWADYTTASYATDHLLAIFDVASDTLVEAVPEARCPAPGNRVHAAEDGTIYFSNWIWPVAGTLLNGAPKSCVLRVLPGSDRFDPDWSLSFDALSGGHEGAMFTYLGDGQGLVSIFDETGIPVDDQTDPWAFAGTPAWTLWNVDVESATGAPVAGMPPNSGAYTPAIFGDRTLLLVPTDGWAATEVYELTDDGAVPGLDVPGWSYAFSQIR